MQPQIARAARDRLLTFGWIARRLAGHPDKSLPDFFKAEFGLGVSEDTVTRAVAASRTGRSPYKDPPGPASKSPKPRAGAEDALIRSDWLLVDERGLGLRTVLVRLPNEGLERPGLFEALSGLSGIRQLVETEEDCEILAVAILKPGEDAADLRARILEHAPGQAIRVHSLRRETHQPAIGSWLDLARNAAKEI